MIKIYHNPRCRKSREGHRILEESGQAFETILYLENKPSKGALQEVLRKLNISPEKLLRKNETIWKENFKGKEMTDDEIIEAMIEYPKLIERPIVINNEKAVIGRPPETIKKIL